MDRHAKAWTDANGIEHLNFDVCAKKARGMTIEQLRYAAKDARAAVKANPLCNVAGRWADESHVFEAEIVRRQTKKTA